MIKKNYIAPGEDLVFPDDSVQAGDAYLTTGGGANETAAGGTPDTLGTLSTKLTAPVNMTYNDASFKLEANSANNTVSVNIVFDESLYNGAHDDNIQYRAFIGPVDPLFAASSDNAAFDGIKPIDSSTVVATIHTSSHIQIRFQGLANATGYSVYVTGANLPKSLGMSNTGYVTTPSKTYTPGNDLSGGYKYINLKAAAGHSFSGQYKFQISVFYDGHGTSSKVGKVVNV